MYNQEGLDTGLYIEGRSDTECKERLYKVYGTDYEVTGRKTIPKPGFLGFGQKDVCRLYYRTNIHKPVSEPAVVKPQLSLEEAQAAIGKITSKMSNAASDDFEKNRNEIILKSQLGQIANKLDVLMKNVSPETNYHPSIKRIEELLTENEFTPSYIRAMCEKVRTQFSLKKLDDYDAVQNAVIDWIGESLTISKDVVKRPPHVVIIVGPTGVGKTTTLVKFAGNLLRDARKNKKADPVVHFITTDFMRVGAYDMLSHYTSILNMSIEKAETAEDVATLFKNYRNNSDYIFIDTSGLSPNDYTEIANMRAVLDVPDMHPEIYLAVTASTKAKDLEVIMRNYEQFNYDSVIITKYDETSSYGNVLSVLSEKNKAISWITTGQQVPRFIERANPGRFLMDLDGFNKNEAHIKEKFNYEPSKEDR